MDDFGDSPWLERAFREHADRLYAYCLSLGLNSAGAADAVHDAFIIATEKAPELADRDHTRAWLYALVRRECRDPNRPAGSAPAGGPAAETIDLGSVVHTAETTAAVAAAANSLRIADRELVELSARHDLSPEEIALVTGLSAAAVTTRLGRAMDRIARQGAPALITRYSALSFPKVTGQLWPRLRKTRETTLPALLTEVARRVGPLDSAGFPRQPDQRSGPRPRRWALVGTGVAASVLVGAGVVFAQQETGTPEGRRQTIEAPPMPLPTGGHRAEGALAASPTPSRRSPSASPSSTPRPSATSAKPTVAPTTAGPSASQTTLVGPKVTASITNPRCQGGWQSFGVTATVTGGTPSRVRLVLHDSSGNFAEDMSSSAGKWSTTSWGYIPTDWYVEATLPGSRVVRTAGQTLDVC
ncbi:RNA polymerase sigma factor [Longispora sp. NPDC051575]|uniref:RNA polymerase sigma factor n=1 Tax=Longispora sp. NPDC051575 TaxID=3154943 RepID=UPI0034287348